jgi:adenylate kinase family enzyme
MKNAQRIMIIGSCGAGKSTLARKLGAQLDLPLVHLDQHHWSAGWVECGTKEWTQKTDELIAADRWIIDGNYGGTMDARIARADTIIFLDYPTWKCLYRITKRITKYWRRTRPDMTPGCNERFNLEFYHYVAVFRIVRRPGILRRLEAVKNTKSVYVIKQDKDAEALLAEFG